MSDFGSDLGPDLGRDLTFPLSPLVVSGDTTAPTIPGVTGATVTAATVTVTLTLTPGTDPDNATNTLLYNIYRDGSKIASGIVGPSWSETAAANGTAYSYGASMSDPAGNEGPVYTLAGSVTWNVSGGGSGSGTSLIMVTIGQGGIG